LGPWEKNPANPILADNGSWKCPGHGSIVADERGRYWLLYHAYSATNLIYTGREALLDEVVFGTNGWPSINNGNGPSVAAVSPFGVNQKHRKGFAEHLGAVTTPGWQWPQDDEPTIESALRTVSESSGFVLVSPTASTNDLLGAVFAKPTTSGDYVATTTVMLPSSRSGSMGGLAAIGDRANAAGVAVGGHLLLWRRDKGIQRILAETKTLGSGPIHLKLIATKGSQFSFQWSRDGKEWTSIGTPQTGEKFPPWDRSIRVGLTVGGVENASARFQDFQLQDGK
jgi:beta-xylosidase